MKFLREIAKKPTHKQMELGTPERTKLFAKMTPGEQAFSTNLDDGRVESIQEARRVQVNDESIHRDIGINSLKNVTKMYGTSRFLIGQKDHKIHATDYNLHDHGDLAPYNHSWGKPVTNGYMTHSKHPTTGEDQYHMAAYRADKDFNFHRDTTHPVIQRMINDHGIQHGTLMAKQGKVRPLNGKERPNQFEVNEISTAGIASMRKMVSDPSTPHHEREAAKHALSKHGLSHSDDRAASHAANNDFFRQARNRAQAKASTPRNVEEHKHYHKFAKDFHYEHTHSHMHTDKDDPSGDSDMTVHHYKHFKGHKVELHTKGTNGNGIVDHWYHIDPQHKATKGKGYAAFQDHLSNVYTKMHESVYLDDDVIFEDIQLFEESDDYAPKKTVTAYKLFTHKQGKLYPLFVNHDKEVPMGKWLHADAGARDPNKSTHVKSKLGPLAMRPGWHSGDLPVATHIGGKSSPSRKKPDYRPDHQVWAQVEHPADHDWQSVANSRGKGKHAHITDQVPSHGHYRYKTNPNMTGNWIISGQMKVHRILPDHEVEAINKAHGTADLPRKAKMKNLRDIVPEAEMKDNFHTPPHKKKKSRETIPMTEISKERLANYRDAADQDWSAQGDKVATANDKIASIPSGNLSARMNAYQARSTAMRRQSRRDKGMAMADRKANVDADKPDYGINEISTALLTKYAAKAAKNGMNKAFKLGQDSMSKGQDRDAISTRKVRNRAAGIAAAVKNLASRDFTYSPNPEKDAGDHEYR